MADVKEWAKQLVDQMKGEWEFKVLSSYIEITTREPDGSLHIHTLEYQSKKEDK